MSRTNNPSQDFASARAAMAGYIRAYQPSRNICRLQLKIGLIDQLDWLAIQNFSTKIFGANQDNSAAIAGVGEALCVQGSGKANFARILTQLRRYLTPQYPFLQWYGGFSFDTPQAKGPWAQFGSWRFVLPRFELARDKDQMIFSCNLTGQINKAKVLKELAGLQTVRKRQRLDLKAGRRQDHPSSKSWSQAVQHVLGRIEAGQCQKVVLARRTDLDFKIKLDPWAILKTLKKVTPDSYHFAFQFGSSTFLGASPERLYKRQGRMILSEALAGTKPAADDPQALLRSDKNRLEHQVVVDAIARCLKQLCERVEFAADPGIKTLSNGHHLVTAFKGYLKDGVKDEDILQSLHPTPALGGSPREFAMKTIRSLEPFDRGWYAGPLGYVGLDWAEFVVGIRSGLVKGRQLSVFAGAGIVQGSKSLDEWREIENKISNFIKIIK